MKPGRHGIHLWLVPHRDAAEQALLERYNALLSDEEIRRASRFRAEVHRSQYVVTRALARTVLSRYSAVDPREWRFSTDTYGRPYVTYPESPQTPAFSISHTEGLIVLACTSMGEIGVDTEHLARSTGPLEIAERYFSVPEVLELKELPAASQIERFLHLWTLKESYIKAIGKGLSTPLNEFSFSLRRAGQIDVSFCHGMSDDPLKWRFWLIKPPSEHVVALCARRVGCEQEIMLHAVVPQESEGVLEWQLLACSSN